MVQNKRRRIEFRYEIELKEKDEPQAGGLSEKVDEQESDDARRARRRAGRDAAARQRRRSAVSDGVALARDGVAVAGDQAYQVTGAQADVTRRQENQRPLRIPVALQK